MGSKKSTLRQPAKDSAPSLKPGPASPSISSNQTQSGETASMRTNVLLRIGHWFISPTARHARQMCRHVHKIVRAQQDILSAPAISAVSDAIQETHGAIERCDPKAALLERMENLEKVANQWLKPYPFASMRENLEVLLVALAVAMGIRTFFLQPFKIPTGSMQPTLYGITHDNKMPDPDFRVPHFARRMWDFWIHGISYIHVQTQSGGVLEAVDEQPKKFLLFNLKQRIQIGGEPHTIWFPPDGLLTRAGLSQGAGHYTQRVFKPGEDVIKLKAISGDHLFVDRLTYNFRRPDRGEIIVFETTGITGLQQNQFYIKRLVALGGEEVRILRDRHLEINGRRLDATTPHFEMVYSFEGPPDESKYSGHMNNANFHDLGIHRDDMAPRFTNENAVVTVRPDHFMVMGDNTMNSFDSRAWGDFSRHKVIGKSFFVYWPINERFGCGW